ncbi:MAG: nickel-binding protein [Solirubrobacteraceae bacterium]
MPVFIIERTFADQLQLGDDDVRLIEEANADEGIRWLFSFLSADRRRTYCLYEAPSAAAIRAAAEQLSIPADAIVEVQGETLGVPGRAEEWAAGQSSG